MHSDGLSLQMTRVFRAPRGRVFELFADAASLARWWGPRGFGIPEIDFRPRAGATYRIGMRPPDAAAFHLTGTFHVVEPPSRLSFSFRWEPPSEDDVETLAELSFREIGDATEVHLTHSGFTTDARRTLHRDGWGESFDKLDDLVSAELSGA